MTAAQLDPADETAEAVRVGDVVHYVLTAQDGDRITRAPGGVFTLSPVGQRTPFASSADEGAITAAIVTAVYSADVVSLQVFADCAGGVLWVASRTRGEGPGEWRTRS